MTLLIRRDVWQKKNEKGGLQRILKLELGVLPIFRRRKPEMPIVLPAFRCNVEPAFYVDMLV